MIDEKAQAAAYESGACDHDNGVCWGKPLVTDEPLGYTTDEPQAKGYTSAQIRRGTRADNRYRFKRRKKGNRAYFEQQRKEQFRRETIAVQLEILQTKSPDHPVYKNVYNGLVAKYGAQIEAMIAAEK